MAGEGRLFGADLLRAAVLAILTLGQVAGVSARQLSVVTVATKQTDGYRRFLRSADIAGLAVTTLGMGEEWQGGDMNYPGGGWKVNLLKAEMQRRSGEAE